MRLPLCALILALATVGMASAASGADPAAIAIQALNAQRVANGIAPVTENTLIDQGCANHLGYIRANGGTLQHGEVQGMPGYTSLGNFGDGSLGEVLGYGTFADWLASGQGPWEDAPYHLSIILDPNFLVYGAAQDANHTCMRPGGGWVNTPTPRFYSYPADGRKNIAPLESVSEVGGGPQVTAGLPEDAVTGFNVLVFSTGCVSYPSGQGPTAATLTGPNGVVDARFVGQKDFGAGDGGIVPVKPLQGGAVYTARITWDCTDGAHTQIFSFTTRRLPNHIELEAAPGHDFGWVVFLGDGSTENIRAWYVDRGRRKPVVLREVAPGEQINGYPMHSADMKVRPGRHLYCIRSGGGDSAYAFASRCTTFESF
ncbi:MAG TPA: hypothetical protein VIL77_10675 [Gaiellaceae bacterium]